MPTGQTVITNVLTKLGLVPQGGTPSASDSVYCLNELNNMWSAWSIDEGLIYAVLSSQFPLTANTASYTIGTGATFDTTRPARIYSAYISAARAFSATTTSGNTVIAAPNTTGVVVGSNLYGVGVPANAFITAVSTNTSVTINAPATASGTVTLTAVGGNRNELNIVDGHKYYAHNDLGALASTPEELYPDYNVDSSGYARLYLWPIPNELLTSYLEIEAGVTFSNWALGTNYQIPPGYQDCIEWTLAFRVLTGFGEAISQGVAQLVAAEATKAEARLRAMNAFNRQLPPQQMAAPGTMQPAQGA